MSSGLDTVIPAWSSCAIRRSTGTFSTSANWAIVTSAMCLHLEPLGGKPRAYSPRCRTRARPGRHSIPRASMLRLEPVGACLHDQAAGLVARQAFYIGDVVDRLLGQLIARAHPAARERQRQVWPHALERQQIVRRHRLVERFLADDRLRQQHVAGAIA